MRPWVMTCLLYTSEKTGDTQAVFRFSSDEDTMKIYPRHFFYQLQYELKDNTVDITYIIQNQDGRTMYFGLGGHPGFMVPLENGMAFEDYCLEFSKASEPNRIGMSRECFVLGEDERWKLEDGRIQRLSHDLFDDCLLYTSIRIFEKDVQDINPKKAQELGVAIIHQELNLCGHLTVAENIFLGHETMKNGLLSDKEMRLEAKKVLDELNMDISPDAVVGDLAVSKQQMIEIAKALSINAKILIMDEPTSALTSKEIEDLFPVSYTHLTTVIVWSSWRGALLHL